MNRWFATMHLYSGVFRILILRVPSVNRILPLRVLTAGAISLFINITGAIAPMAPVLNTPLLYVVEIWRTEPLIKDWYVDHRPVVHWSAPDFQTFLLPWIILEGAFMSELWRTCMYILWRRVLDKLLFDRNEEFYSPNHG